MALEDIKKKIISDAQKEADAIKKENTKKVSDLKKAASEELDTIRSNSLESAKNKAKDKLKSALIDQKIKNSNTTLKAKRQIIDEILDNTLDELKNIPDSDYEKLVERQIKKISTINLKGAKVLCAKGKTELIKKTFEKNAKNSQNSYEESSDVDGGFKIQTENSVIDLSFANIIEENKYTLESEINKIVFTK